MIYRLLGLYYAWRHPKEWRHAKGYGMTLWRLGKNYWSAR